CASSPLGNKHERAREVGQAGCVCVRRARAMVKRLCATVEHQAYARKCGSPFHVQRDRPNERFRKETVASIPARKRLRIRRSRGVEVISSIGKPTGFEKHTSEVPEAFRPSRFALDANPPSNATRSGATPKSFLCLFADRSVSVESAGLPVSMTRSSTSPLRP